MNKPKVVAVVGPTASGKTSLSIELAKRFGGEVISCDSRQVYRELNVGTGKVTESEMEGIPHHLIDVVNVSETYTATDFLKDATTAIEKIKDNNSLPIIAGGTFFYLDQLRGKGRGPDVPPNPKLREVLEDLSEEQLFTRLKETDPNRASLIDRNNKRRLVRSLEIVDSLGYVPEVKDIESPYDWLVLGIERDKHSLLDRYQRRATSWITGGILEETEWLKERVSIERFGEFGFEYILANKVLEKEIDESAFVEQFIQKNWQYAKRQMTWLKRDQEIKWYGVNESPQIYSEVETFLQE